ncbi:hypothetical protein V3F56_02950 [Moorellaceae bacterium AZ2]
MRNWSINLLIAGLFLFMISFWASQPALAGYEDPVPEGQLIKAYIDVAYFQLWKHSNGVWQDTDHDGTHDLPGQVKTWSYKVTGVLGKLINSWDVTGVRVRYLGIDEWSPAIYQQCGGYGGMSFEDFDKRILLYSAAKGHEGKVWAETRLPGDLSYTLHYENIRLAGNPEESDVEIAKKGAMDLKDDKNIQFLKTLGIPLQVPSGGFLQMAEGWNYWIPYIVEIYGKPKQLPDLYVKNLDPGTDEAEDGVKYTGTVVFGLAADYGKPVKATLSVTNNGWAAPTGNGSYFDETWQVEFKPGEEKTFKFAWTGDASGNTLVAKIHPVDPPNDVNWDNNKQEVYVPPVEREESGPGELTFQAVSQDRTITREPGTAKWTDWVTATLRPPKPVPPRGRVTWWRITSAELTYPKKHPEFTFGTPYPPEGTVTVAMEPREHEAVVEFQEDWAMDGAQIYSILEDRMMAVEPKYYTITVRYTIEYEYRWTERDSEGHSYTRTARGTTSGTVSGQLLVNGTGVWSLAQ